MGGEEPELNPRKENYMFDINSSEMNHTLHLKVSLKKIKNYIKYLLMDADAF
jgi:N-acetylneuraminic acid mutarotase